MEQRQREPRADERVYRVDRFVVPAQAREEFLARVRRTQRLLESLAGYEDGAVLEQRDGDGRANVVTIAVWCDRHALADARPIVRTRYQQEGFDPGALMHRLGIQADMADYEPVGEA